MKIWRNCAINWPRLNLSNLRANHQGMFEEDFTADPRSAALWGSGPAASLACAEQARARQRAPKEAGLLG